MNRIFKVAFVFIISLVVFSCNNNDVVTVAEFPIEPYATQYGKDIVAIETYLKTHSMSVTDHAGFPDDQDVSFSTVTAGDANSIWGSDLLNPKSSLLSKPVLSNGVNYKVYYIKLREGVGENPTRVDSVFTSYKGQTLEDLTFDQAPNPIWLRLDGVIDGWKEIFPLFKIGAPGIANANGTVTYNDFGAGVMFLPSGLAYYNKATGTIPAYSPLIFSFKLNQLNYTNQDYDRIDSRYEDMNGNGIFTDDDTDGDGHPNYLDIDDDGDGIPTKTEIKRPARDINGDIMLDSSSNPIYVGYYPYNGAAVDDPLTTTIDETQGIPRKFTGPLRNPSLPESATNRRRPLPSDYTDPLRLRRHLDSSSKFPYEN